MKQQSKSKIYNSEELRQISLAGGSLTDWKKVDACAETSTDDDLPEGFWENARVIHPTKKAHISFRIDADLLEWFKNEALAKNAKGYQSMIHNILASYRQQQESR